MMEKMEKMEKCSLCNGKLTEDSTYHYFKNNSKYMHRECFDNIQCDGIDESFIVQYFALLRKRNV